MNDKQLLVGYDSSMLTQLATVHQVSDKIVFLKDAPPPWEYQEESDIPYDFYLMMGHHKIPYHTHPKCIRIERLDKYAQQVELSKLTGVKGYVPLRTMRMSYLWDFTKNKRLRLPNAGRWVLKPSDGALGKGQYYIESPTKLIRFLDEVSKCDETSLLGPNKSKGNKDRTPLAGICDKYGVEATEFDADIFKSQTYILQELFPAKHESEEIEEVRVVFFSPNGARVSASDFMLFPRYKEDGVLRTGDARPYIEGTGISETLEQIMGHCDLGLFGSMDLIFSEDAWSVLEYCPQYGTKAMLHDAWSSWVHENLYKRLKERDDE